MASTRFSALRLSRRGFLTGSVTAPFLALQRRGKAASSRVDGGASPERGVERVFQRLRGPVVPINIPLAKDYSVDYGNLRSYVDFLCENQAPVIFFTHGSSEFKSMSEHEIEKLCRTAAEQARGRALVIGGTGKWWTGKSIDFIRRLEDSGVDGINLHLFTKKPEEVYAAFSEVSSRTRLPLLGYDENYSPDLVARLSTIPRVCGLKSHDALYRYHDFIRAVKDKKFVVIGGGQMRNFLYGYLIGSQGYLCAYAPFAPAIAFRGPWNATIWMKPARSCSSMKAHESGQGPRRSQTIKVCQGPLPPICGPTARSSWFDNSSSGRASDRFKQISKGHSVDHGFSSKPCPTWHFSRARRRSSSSPTAAASSRA